MGLYNGISASLFQQLTCSTARFGIYEICKQSMSNAGLSTKVLMAAAAGAGGGLIGIPADVINVRMQHDFKLSREERKNYKNVLDGFNRICHEEGASRLFTGGTIATSQSMILTIAQLPTYDQIKSTMLFLGIFKDNVKTHFIAGIITAIIATTLTQPLDVVKTKVINAKPGKYTGIIDVIKHTAKKGAPEFFKGYVSSFLVIGPHTVIMFLIIEQLRLHFGYFPQN